MNNIIWAPNIMIHITNYKTPHINMEYADIPDDVTEEILLSQDSEQLITHCNTAKNTYEKCNNVYFWAKYIKNKKKYQVEELLISLIRNSQSFVQPLYEAISKKYILSDEVKEVVIFYSNMRRDKQFLSYLDTNIAISNLDWPNSVIKAVNNIIDEINSNHANIDIIENEINMLLYTFVFMHHSNIPLGITNGILDKCRLESIKNIPSMVNSESNNSYDKFCISVIKSLANNTHIADLIYLMNKFYDNNVILNSYYIAIAEYLPTELYSYVQRKLPEKVNLVSKINYIRDLDHANYIMVTIGYPNKLSQYVTIGEYISAREFVNKVKSNKGIIEYIKKLNNNLLRLLQPPNSWILEVTELLGI